VNSKSIRDINYVSHAVDSYIKESDGKFYISDEWDRDEALSLNVDYSVATDFLMRAVSSRNKWENNNV
jgi:hypothetical protein